MTLEQAMKFFWLTHSVTFDSQTVYFNNFGETGAETESINPRKRVCLDFGPPSNISIVGEGTNEQVFVSLFPGSHLPARMYDGSTDNENNFIGYGYGLYGSTNAAEIDPVISASKKYPNTENPDFFPTRSGYSFTSAQYQNRTPESTFIDDIPFFGTQSGDEPRIVPTVEFYTYT